MRIEKANIPWGPRDNSQGRREKSRRDMQPRIVRERVPTGRSDVHPIKPPHERAKAGAFAYIRLIRSKGLFSLSTACMSTVEETLFEPGS
jgi:hypothetical protein